jgi:hypothetical protein
MITPISAGVQVPALLFQNHQIISYYDNAKYKSRGEMGLVIMRAMVRFIYVLVIVSSLCGTLFLAPATGAAARDTSMKSLNARRLQAMHRWEPSARGQTGEDNVRRSAGGQTRSGTKVKNVTFSNPKAARAYCAVVKLRHVCPV